MRDTEIALPSSHDFDAIERAIDAVIALSGLDVTLRDTLKKYPGCTHWHLKNGRTRGTLEITLWPRERRAWFTIHAGRRAQWMEDAMPGLAEALGKHLKK